MRIGILGSGLMGGKLGTLFARVGHDVTFSYARQTEKLKRLAKDAGSHARAGTPREAAQDADALLLAVHLATHGRCHEFRRVTCRERLLSAVRCR